MPQNKFFTPQQLGTCNLYNPTLSVKLNNFIHQSPSWEAKRSAASHKIPSILRNLKVHFWLCNSLEPIPFLRKIHPIHVPPTHLPKTALTVYHLKIPGWCNYWSSKHIPLHNAHTQAHRHTYHLNRDLSCTWEAYKCSDLDVTLCHYNTKTLLIIPYKYGNATRFMYRLLLRVK
jgi:hypothetical protein